VAPAYDPEALKPVQIVPVASANEQQRIAASAPDHLHVWFVNKPGRGPAR
jgi:hypothetical protein